MVVIAFPLASDLVRSLLAIVRNNGTGGVANEIRVVVKRLAFLGLPLIFGTYVVTLLALNASPLNRSVNWLQYTYYYTGLVPFALLALGDKGVRLLLAGEEKGIKLLGLWLGATWAFLYFSLCVQLYLYVVPTIR